MTGCENSNTALPDSALDARVGNLVPAVVSLLQRVTSVEPTVHFTDANSARLSSPLSFPDGIGEGEVIGELFVYRDRVRLDVHLEHNRVFAMASGAPSDRRCYLNDYVASVTLDEQADTLGVDFIRSVVAGIAAARDAVRRHNRRASVPWNEVRIAARVPETVV